MYYMYTKYDTLNYLKTYNKIVEYIFYQLSFSALKVDMRNYIHTHNFEDMYFYN
jgi:hypothetical protein